MSQAESSSAGRIERSIQLDEVSSPKAAYLAATNAPSGAFTEGLAVDGLAADVDAVLALFPGDPVVLRLHRGRSNLELFVRCENGHALVSVNRFRPSISVCSASAAKLDGLVTHVCAMLPELEPVTGTRYQRWHMHRTGPMVRSFDGDFPAWCDIAGNYPSAISDALARLMQYQAPAQGPRLILWHGEAGTGKTTALRSLLREWSSWAIGEYVLDPEVFFNDPSYMVDVMRHSTGMVPLVVAEDCDDYLRASGPSNRGVSRFLNLTDGLLGADTTTMVLVTTNAEIGRLHPAVTRPGRCLAHIEFAAFGAAAARRWRTQHGVIAPHNTTPVTLAELYRSAGATEQITVAGSAPPGARTSYL